MTIKKGLESKKMFDYYKYGFKPSIKLIANYPLSTQKKLEKSPNVSLLGFSEGSYTLF